MKYIFIDSNIFFNHWFLETPNFVFLFNYLENSGSKLLLSNLVCEEVQYQHDKILKDSIGKLEKTLQEIQALNQKQMEYDFDKLNQQYDFKLVLANKIESIVFYEYEKISQRTVVERAIINMMPFRENEKGYRDTLIWLSLLEYLRKSKIKGDIIFISSNSADFYNGTEVKFHNHLLKDIADFKIKNSISPYVSLQAFIATLEKDEYEVVFNQKIEAELSKNEELIEVLIEAFIKNLPISELQKLVRSVENSFPYINTILDFSFEIDEGIEDLNIKSYKKVSKSSVYLNCEFELRLCTFLLRIPISEYLQNKQNIDRVYQNLDIDEDDNVYFERYFRPFFEVNFIFDLEEQGIEGFEVVKMTFKAR